MSSDFPREPVVRLWRNVLYQAFVDATIGVKHRKSAGGVRPRALRKNDRYYFFKRELERRQALSWFNQDNSDFRFVCSCAGLDPDAVAVNFKRYYE